MAEPSVPDDTSFRMLVEMISESNKKRDKMYAMVEFLYLDKYNEKKDNDRPRKPTTEEE